MSRQNCLLAVFLAIVGTIFFERVAPAWNISRAAAQRDRFCRHLLAGNKAAALNTIPKDAEGRAALEFFFAQRWPINECRDDGPPGDYDERFLYPYPCPILRQDIHIGLSQPVYSKEGYSLEPHLSFVYTCDTLSKYTWIFAAEGTIDAIKHGPNGRIVMSSEWLTAHTPTGRPPK